MQSKLVFPRSIRYLFAVAEHHSFTRAAEVLHVSQPTLSQQIRLLEEALDVQLLDRSGRNVRLTDAGEVYLRHARRALVELEAGTRAIHEVQDLSRGSLRVGMTPITEYLTTKLLENFVISHPGIVMSAVEMPQDDIEASVAEDKIDVGIVFTDTLASEARSSEIDKHILFVETLNLAVGNAHHLAGRNVPLSGSELERESLVMLSTNFALRRHFDLYCLEYGITPHIAVETNSLNMIVQTVALGRLVTVLPSSIANSQPGLFSVPLLPELPHHTIALICHKGSYKSAACAAFGAMATEWSAGRCQMASADPMRPCSLIDGCDQDECDYVADQLAASASAVRVQ
jgi:LysR family transcriptional regulator, cyn operon transcriptional activator